MLIHPKNNKYTLHDFQTVYGLDDFYNILEMFEFSDYCADERDREYQLAQQVTHNTKR